MLQGGNPFDPPLFDKLASKFPILYAYLITLNAASYTVLPDKFRG